ncbi:hypothetical protein K1719_037991 [Acacia pycnantha]|nr:hypothetical protein K1719_037991 [Acacia pycnantha]
MAQLPPKIPNMAPNWLDFSSHHKMLSLASLSPNNVATNATAIAAACYQNPSWVDKFLNFLSVRQGAHRQSMSDSIPFMSMMDEVWGRH